jgi:predicted transcriptional regulator
MAQSDTPSTTINLRIPKRVKHGLEELARSTSRSKSFLAVEALDSYLKANAWQVEKINEAVAKLDAGAPTIPHESVEAWVRSWGTDEELPKPTA